MLRHNLCRPRYLGDDTTNIRHGRISCQRRSSAARASPLRVAEGCSHALILRNKEEGWMGGSFISARSSDPVRSATCTAAAHYRRRCSPYIQANCTVYRRLAVPFITPASSARSSAHMLLISASRGVAAANYYNRAFLRSWPLTITPTTTNRSPTSCWAYAREPRLCRDQQAGRRRRRGESRQCRDTVEAIPTHRGR
jgi:hypothetical protein